MSGPWCPLTALLQVTRDPKSVGRISHVGIIPEAGRRTQIFSRAVERASPQHPKPTLSREPRRTILGRAAIIIVPAILHPLRRVACGVVKTIGVRLIRTDRRRLLRSAGIALPAVRLAGAHVAAPPIGGVRPTSGGIFPFGFARQPISLSRFLRKPSHEGLRIEPADIDDRTVASSPFPILGAMLAAPIGDAHVPLIECYFVSANGKRLRDRDPVRRVFVFGRGAHIERPGWHHQHLNAALTIAENVACLRAGRRRGGSR